jgi:hypothetical protein
MLAKVNRNVLQPTQQKVRCLHAPASLIVQTLCLFEAYCHSRKEQCQCALAQNPPLNTAPDVDRAVRSLYASPSLAQ